MLPSLLEEEELECNASWELGQGRSRGGPPPDHGGGSGLEASSDFFTLYSAVEVVQGLGLIWCLDPAWLS